MFNVFKFKKKDPAKPNQFAQGEIEKEHDEAVKFGLKGNGFFESKSNVKVNPAEDPVAEKKDREDRLRHLFCTIYD